MDRMARNDDLLEFRDIVSIQNLTGTSNNYRFVTLAQAVVQ